MKKNYCKRTRLAVWMISAILIFIPSGVYASGTDEYDTSAEPGEASSTDSDFEPEQTDEGIAAVEKEMADSETSVETELTQPEEEAESPDSEEEEPTESDSGDSDPDEDEPGNQEPDDAEMEAVIIIQPPVQSDQTEEPVQIIQTEEPAQMIRAEEPAQMIQAEEPVQIIQTEEPVQTIQAEEPVQIIQTEATAQTTWQPAVQVSDQKTDPLPRRIIASEQTEPATIAKTEEITQEKQPEDDRNPEIRISGVEDRSANRKPLSVSVEFRDENLLNESVYAYLTATGSGKRTDAVVREETQTGMVLTFPEVNRDDYYVLTTGCRDRAGNETVQTVSFTENRKGAVISLKNVSLKDSAVSQLRVVPEFRISGIDEVTEADADVNGKSVPVKFNKEGNLILTDPLTEEGEYTVRLRTKDASGNEVNSEPVTFAIDRTKPSLSMEMNAAADSKRQDSFEVVISKDQKDDRFTEILLDGRQLKETDYTTLKDGSIKVRVSGSGQHTVRAAAEDAAGNTESMSRTFSVTEKNKQNGKNRWGSILFLIAGAAGAAALIRFKIRRLPRKQTSHDLTDD